MKLKNWILKKKSALILLAVGAVAGFLYWNFIGCASGNCGIKAKWHTSIAYGALMGWLVGDFSNEKINPSKDK